MHLDVIDLRSFYYRTGLGRAAQRALRDQVVAMWPEAKGQTVAGFGFAVPLMRPFLTDARRVIGLMPGQQGVMPWPPGLDNVSLLVEEAQWPIPTGMVDKLVMLHALEASDDPAALLEEAARVLGPGGRVIFIVPNRTGLWSRFEGTPFGHGKPYTSRQMEALLRRHGFTVERSLSALYFPPSQRRFWLRAAGFWESVGRRLQPMLSGGVLMMEASKQVYAPTRGGLVAAVRRPLRVLEGVGQPVPELGFTGAEPQRRI